MKSPRDKPLALFRGGLGVSKQLLCAIFPPLNLLSGSVAIATVSDQVFAPTFLSNNIFYTLQ